MDSLLTLARLEATEAFFFGIIAAGGFLVAIIATVTSAVQKVMETRHREETRREIAAYVAEGTISADDATKILASGKSVKESLRQRA